jgi:hypothetical protein
MRRRGVTIAVLFGAFVAIAAAFVIAWQCKCKTSETIPEKAPIPNSTQAGLPMVASGPLGALVSQTRETGTKDKAIEKVKDEKTSAEIARTIGDKNAPMGERVAALELAGYSDHPEVDAALKSACADENASIRSAAVTVAAKRSSPDSLSTIMQVAKDKDAGVRRSAAYALADRNEKEALKALVALLDDEDSLVRKVASGALSKRASQDFGYKYSASKTERAEAVKKWQNWVEAK